MAHVKGPYKVFRASNGVMMGIGIDRPSSPDHAQGVTDAFGGLWGSGKERDDTAEFIVRACNSHGKLLAALQSACEAIHEHAPGLEYLAESWEALITKSQSPNTQVEP